MFFSDRAGWLLDDINCIKAEFKERIMAENDKANSGYEPSAASKVCSSMASYGMQSISKKLHDLTLPKTHFFDRFMRGDLSLVTICPLTSAN